MGKQGRVEAKWEIISAPDGLGSGFIVNMLESSAGASSAANPFVDEGVTVCYVPLTELSCSLHSSPNLASSAVDQECRLKMWRNLIRAPLFGRVLRVDSVPRLTISSSTEIKCTSN